MYRSHRTGTDLPDLCGSILYPSYGGQPVPEWNTGDGIWNPSDDGGSRRADWKRSRGGHSFEKAQLCGRVSCKSDGLGAGRWPAFDHVFLDHAES